MRLAFNATALLSPLTGIGQYAFHLGSALRSFEDVEADFFYGLHWSHEVRTTPVAAAGRVLPWVRRHVPFAYSVRRALMNYRFARHAARKHFDVYHEPNYLPMRFDGPTVVTVHDLSWIRFPGMHPRERVAAMERYFPPALHRADLLLTDSVFVQHELMDVFGVEAARIRPIPLGVESAFQPRTAEQTRAALEGLGLVHGQYLLAVGTMEPRKNLGVALMAYSLLPKPLRQRLPLVLAGMKGWHTSELERQLQPLVQTGEIRVLGYLPREMLTQVTAGACALVYPSVYEGFGLPPLEAMACGVPVIASDVSSIPEVVDDTGILVNPHDADALAAAMASVAEDSGLRETLGLRAYQRSRGFTWQSCAARTVAAYREAIARH